MAEQNGKVAELESEALRRAREESQRALEQRVVFAAQLAGVRPEHLDDLQLRARRGDFAVVEGEIVVVDPEGLPRYGGDRQPLTVDRWLRDVRTEGLKPGWFEVTKPSRGNGAWR